MTPAVRLCLPGTPKGEGGACFLLPPTPFACGGLDGGMTQAVHLCLPGTPRGGGRGLALYPPPLCMRWVGWGDDTGCAPVPARHPEGGGGGLAFCCPPPPALHALGWMGA